MEKIGKIKILVLTVLMIASLSGTGTAIPSLSKDGGGSWQYYRDITVEKSGNTVTNYQVLVQLASSSFPTTRSDGADIRFTDSNGNELSYWIENWDYAGKSAIVWVKMPSIPAKENTNIKMYYGNPSASSSSNGDNTFDFFDDFSTNSLKLGWSFENPGVDDGFSLSERPGWMRIKVIGYSDLWTDSDKAPFLRRASPSGNYVVQIIEDGTDVKLDQHSLLRYSIGTGFGLQGSGYFGVYSSQTAVKFEANGYRREGPCDTLKKIHYIRFRKLDSTLFFDWSIDGINWNNCGNYMLSSDPSYWGLGGKSWGDGNFNVDFDYFIIRKYVSSEPTVAIGAEQMPTIPTPTTPSPLLSVSQDPFFFNLGTMNAGESTYLIFVLSNSGGGTLNWEVSTDQPWITFNPTSGTNYGTVTININTAGLNPGSYLGTITVTSNGGNKKGSISFNIPEVAPPTGLVQIIGVILVLAGLVFTALTTVKKDISIEVGISERTLKYVGGAGILLIMIGAYILLKSFGLI